MLRYCALSRSLVKIRLQDTSFPHFSKTLRSLCLILSWKSVVKSKNKFNNNLRQGLLFLYAYFLCSISHSNRPKKRGKESQVLKKPIIFCAKDLIHTVGNKWDHNKALLKIWRESDKRAILFFQTKKEHKKWNPLEEHPIVPRMHILSWFCVTRTWVDQGPRGKSGNYGGKNQENLLLKQEMCCKTIIFPRGGKVSVFRSFQAKREREREGERD